MQRCTVLDSAYMICIQMFCKSTVSPSGNLTSFKEKGVTEQLVAVTFYMFLVPTNGRVLHPEWFCQWQLFILSSYFNSIITAVCS